MPYITPPPPEPRERLPEPLEAPVECPHCKDNPNAAQESLPAISIDLWGEKTIILFAHWKLLGGMLLQVRPGDATSDLSIEVGARSFVIETKHIVTALILALGLLLAIK